MRREKKDENVLKLNVYFIIDLAKNSPKTINNAQLSASHRVDLAEYLCAGQNRVNFVESAAGCSCRFSRMFPNIEKRYVFLRSFVRYMAGDPPSMGPQAVHTVWPGSAIGRHSIPEMFPSPGIVHRATAASALKI